MTKVRPNHTALGLTLVASLILAGGTAHALENPGFEMPDKGAGGWEYFNAMDAGELTAAVWTYTGGGAGLSGPNGPWRCNSVSPDPLGDQFAYLQRDASISQDLTNLVVGVTYVLNFFESYRTAYGNSNDLHVILDEGLGTETNIYHNPAVTNTTWEARQTAAFTAAKTSYTLTFRTTFPPGAGDRTTIFDGVALDILDLPGPPTVISLNPEDDAVDVAPWTDLASTFNETIVAGDGDIIISNLTDATAIVIPATNAQVSVDGPVVTINPIANLVALKDYAVLIDTNAIEDISGNAFAGITNTTNWSFTTAPPDTTPPTVANLSPADDAVDVATDADLVITFDEVVLKGTGNIEIREFIGDAVFETIDVASANVTVSGTDVTINPAGDLANAVDYYVAVAAGAVQDLSGNPFAGIAVKSAWNFTTVAANPITYHHITGDADSDISTNKTYTHTLDFGTGTPGALINGVQFAPYNNAANGTLNFNRTVATGQISHHAGNANHNVSDALVNLLTDMYYNGQCSPGGTTTWTLSGLTAGVTYDTRIYVRTWGPGTGTSRLVTHVFDPDGPGPISDATGLINEDDATSVGLAPGNAAYYISYQFTAVAGQDLVITATQNNQNNSWHLYGLTNEEGGPDTTAPTVSTLNPTDDASGVLVVRDLVVTFNEGIAAGPGNITITNLTNATGMVIPASNAQVSVAGPVLTIDPTADLAPTNDYAVLIDTNAVADLAGNPFAGITNPTTWNFTTAELDLTAPTFTSLSPVDDAEDLSTGIDLMITFDENVQRGTGSILIKRTDDDTVFETVDVTAATVTINGSEVTINPTGDLAVATGYYVEIAAGAIEDLSGNAFAGIADSATWNFTTADAGFISYHQIADDADSGLTTNRTYTHAIDFGNTGAATVNGVVFGTDVNVAAGGRANSGTRTYGPNQTGDTPPAVSGGITNVFRDFRYNGPDLGYVELTGLTAGRMYDLRLYERPWDYGGFVRTYYAHYDLGGDGSAEFATLKVDQNRPTLYPPWFSSNVSWAVSYVYRADTTGKIRVVIDLADDQTGTYHLYGLTNEELPTDNSIYWIRAGVSNVASTSVWAHATVSTNLDEAVLVWDRSDQGTGSPDDWANAISLGARPAGVVTGEATNLLADTRYVFRLYGTNASPTDGWAGATIFATAFSAAQTPVFTNVTATPWNVITLGWQDNASNETGYVLQRSDAGSGGPYSVIAVLDANATSYREAVLPGATYFYQLAATNASNGSATDFAACRIQLDVPPPPVFEGVLFRDDFSETDTTFNQTVENNLSLSGSAIGSMTQDGPTYTTIGGIGGEDGNATWRTGTVNTAFIPNYDFALDATLTNAGWFMATLKDLTPSGDWAAVAVFDSNALDAQNITDNTVGLGALFGPGPGGAIQVWSQGSQSGTIAATTPAPPFDVTIAVGNISGFGPGNSFDYEILVNSIIVNSGTKTGINTATNFILVEGWGGASSAGELEVRTGYVSDRGMVLIVR